VENLLWCFPWSWALLNFDAFAVATAPLPPQLPAYVDSGGVLTAHSS
jgi:hypothetical protein